jgi:hypothetical protein
MPINIENNAHKARVFNDGSHIRICKSGSYKTWEGFLGLCSRLHFAYVLSSFSVAGA